MIQPSSVVFVVVADASSSCMADRVATLSDYYYYYYYVVSAASSLLD
jgi:hypothetical protein